MTSADSEEKAEGTARAPRRARDRRPAQRPLGFCPFTGDHMQVIQKPAARMYAFRNKRYMFGPFRSMPELLVAFSTRDGVPPEFPSTNLLRMKLQMAPANLASRPPPAKGKLDKCPFFGTPVEIIASKPGDPNSNWNIKSRFYIIGGFPSKRAAEFFFSTRLGVTPIFPASETLDDAVTIPGELIAMRDRGDTPESPSEALADLGVDELKEGADFLKDTGLIK